MDEAVEREISQLRSLFRSDRDPDGRAFATLADAYRRVGKHEQALELLAEGLERHPGFATGHVVAAWVHRDRGARDEAIDAFRRVLELDGQNVAALHGLGRLLVVRGESQEAARLLNRANQLGWVMGSEPTVHDLAEAEAEAAQEEAAQEEAAVAPEVDEAPESEEAPAAAAMDDVFDMGALAPEPQPEEEDEEQDVLDMGALAPESEEEAPGAAEEGDVFDVGALAPEPEEAPVEAVEEDVFDMGALAPEPEPEEEMVFDMGALAPEAETEEPVAEEPVVSAAGPEFLEPPEPPMPPVGLETPDAPPERPAAPTPPAGPRPSGTPAPGGPRTRTMAELYVRQGLVDRAIEVYEHLLAASPGDEELRARLDELGERSGAGAPTSVPPSQASSGVTAEQETEAAAADMADSGHHDSEPSPFSWVEGAAEEAAPAEEAEEEEPVTSYLGSMVGWEPESETEEEEPLAMEALAPDEDVLDMGALAPEPEPEDEVLNVGALAPEPEEEVLDMGALAPEPEPEEGDPVLDAAAFGESDRSHRMRDGYVEPADEMEEVEIGGLDLALGDDAEEEQPEDDDVLDMGALAPDDDEEIVDLRSLAPEPGDDPGRGGV